MSASGRLTSRRLALVRQRLVSCLKTCFCIFDWHLEDRRRDTGRLFASAVSHGILTLVFAFFGILCQIRDDQLCNARRRFGSVVSYGVF